MYKIIFPILGLLMFQSCIKQEITQNNIFNPVKEYELSPEFDFKRNFIYGSDSIRIESWYLTENNPQFNLIYFSGNGSNIRSAIPFFNELGEQFDLNIFSINYNGYGLSDGEPSINGIVNDAKLALVYFKNEIGDKDLPTIVLGYSLGGFVALNVVNSDIVDRGIIMSSFTSIKELQNYLLKEALPGIIRPFLKLKIDESIYTLDNTKLVQQTAKPILFIHGDADDFIPKEMSYSLFNLCSSKKKSIKIIAGADHRTILKDTLYNKLVVAEIKKIINK